MIHVYLLGESDEQIWKLLESLGFRREAHFRQNVYFWKDADGSPIWKDTYVYAILESDESIRKDSKL